MSPEPWADARARLTTANLAPMEWPNEPFVQPDLSTNPGPWLSVESTGDGLLPIEMGGGGWEETGRLFVHVSVPAFSGSDAARAMAKQVANVFRGIGPNPTIYERASVGGGQIASPEGTVWRITVVVDYRYQDTGTSTP